jgi:hypothetical protein
VKRLMRSLCPKCVAQKIPSPVWGGLGWGSLRIQVLSEVNDNFKHLRDPHPGPPHKGEGEINKVALYSETRFAEFRRSLMS